MSKEGECIFCHLTGGKQHRHGCPASYRPERKALAAQRYQEGLSWATDESPGKKVSVPKGSKHHAFILGVRVGIQIMAQKFRSKR